VIQRESPDQSTLPGLPQGSLSIVVVSPDSTSTSMRLPALSATTMDSESGDQKEL
jgi:hypothetical protein